MKWLKVLQCWDITLPECSSLQQNKNSISLFSWTKVESRYIKVKVEHYLLLMFSPPKISWVITEIKYICLHLLPVFDLIQSSSKQIICFDFRKQNSVLPIVFYVPILWLKEESGRKGRVYGKVEEHKGCSFFNNVLLACPIRLPIFSLLSNEPELGTELDPGMVMTQFPSSI